MNKSLRKKLGGALVLALFVINPAVLSFIPNLQSGQSVPGREVVLVADPRHIPYHVPPPGPAMLGVQTATINVNFNPASCPAAIAPWPAAAMGAFNFAAGIWGSLINSNQVIVVDACWRTDLAANVLGSAGPTTVHRDFTSAPVASTWYVAALANSLANADLNGGTADIRANFNSNFTWYFGTDGNTPSNQFDFASVVLHEVGHGLGFLGFANVDTGNNACGSNTVGHGCIGLSGFPAIYDRFTEDGNGTPLLGYVSPSAVLGNALTGNIGGGVVFDGANANAANGGARVPLFAPAAWSPGSSYSHLAEVFNNTPNALMTFSLGFGESEHSPGPVTLGLFRDLGWGVERADLSVAKSDSPDPVVAGTDLTYTLNVTNNGPDQASNVTVVDNLSSSVTLVSASSGCSGSTTITCNLGNLASGASTSATIVVHVPSSTPSGATLLNIATVTGNEVDPNPGNNTTRATTTVTRQTDLATDKTDAPDPVVAGTTLAYTIYVVNGGPSNASGVTVVDTLPPNVTLVPTPGCSGTPIVTCSVGNLPNGANTTVTIVVTVDPSTPAGTILTNTATVTGNEADPNVGNDTASSNTTVTRQANLAITKTDAPDPVILGNDLTYTLNVTNNGPSDASNVLVTDTLPEHVIFVPGSCIENPPASGTVTCSLSNLSSGATTTFAVVVTPQPIIVVPDKTGTITNTATVSASEPDPDSANNLVTEITTVVQLPESCDLSGANVIIGTPDNDVLIGTSGDDVILGLGGNDRIFGRDGDDCLDGDGDRDHIFGGKGDDLIFGHGDRDTIIGDEGDDLILGGLERDLIIGSRGDDVIFGDRGPDRITGGDGDDLIVGDDGTDRLDGGDGNDHVFGGNSRDQLRGGRGNDILEGGIGQDFLQGNLGDDELDGGPNRDRLDGGGDVDICVNGEEVIHCEAP